VRGFVRVAAAFGALALCAGCPAQAVLQDDAAPQEDAGQVDAQDDLLPPEDAPPDVPAPDDACASEGVETACGDGCDNDGDGFADGDDPDCVTAFLVTREPPDGVLRWRVGDADVAALHPGGTPGRPIVDSAHLPLGYAVQRGMPPGRGLYRFDPKPDPAPGPELVLDVGFQASDVCVFAGRVVVTELTGPRLHAYHPGDISPDGGTAFASATLTRGTLVRACAADATRLYAVVATASGTDDVVELDADLVEVSWPGLPTGLAADEKRLLDLAWDRRTGQFYGLFVGTETNTAAVTPFAMGGAAAPAVTAPFALSTLSTFAP
jgi:hypothetical protein